jgi:hexosaminidase
VPLPVSINLTLTDSFTITAATTITVDSESTEAARIGEMLARTLRPSTGYPVPVSSTTGGANRIALRLAWTVPTLGEEGYRLTISTDSIALVAGQPAGLFRGVQPLRQLLPPGIEAEQSVQRMGTWTVPVGIIIDQPRFAWRGAMLDVARHFFTVHEVKQYIDLLALYKLSLTSSIFTCRTTRAGGSRSTPGPG